MKIKPFGEACSAQITATSKISKPKVEANDFMRFAKTCALINACDKRATKVELNGETFNFDELEVPALMKGMVYPSVLTPNGDLNSEADFLTRDFGKIIEFDSNDVIKPFNGYELIQFCSALYGVWKSEAETVKVSDIRVAAPMNPEVIKLTCMGDQVSAEVGLNFPIATKFKLISDEKSTEDVDKIVKLWIVKTLIK